MWGGRAGVAISWNAQYLGWWCAGGWSGSGKKPGPTFFFGWFGGDRSPGPKHAKYTSHSKKQAKKKNSKTKGGSTESHPPTSTAQHLQDHTQIGHQLASYSKPHLNLCILAMVFCCIFFVVVFFCFSPRRWSSRHPNSSPRRKPLRGGFFEFLSQPRSGPRARIPPAARLRLRLRLRLQL